MANLNTPVHGMLKGTLPIAPTNGRIQMLTISGDFHTFRIMVNALLAPAARQQTGLHQTESETVIV
jgi:hypothetical protein